MPKYSDSARDVAQGLKKKELDTLSYQVCVFFSIVIGCFFGWIFKNFWVGFVVFLVLGNLTFRWYFKK